VQTLTPPSVPASARGAARRRFRRPVAAALLALAASAAFASFGQSAEAARQTATIQVLPGIVQPGASIASPDSAKAVVIATFTPATKGRLVHLQKKVGSQWVKVASGRQNSRGRVQFRVSAGTSTSPITYRALAPRSTTLRTVASASAATSQWGTATFTDQFNGTTLSDDWIQRGQYYEPASMRACSKGDPSATAVSGGALRLGVIRDTSKPAASCAAHKYDGSLIGNFDYRFNGHVSTQGRYFLRYGVVAARIKFERLQGQHASLWMQPQFPTYLPNAFQGGAEIDIIEYFGHGVKNGGLTSFVYAPREGAPPEKIGGWITKPERFLSSKKDRWFKRYHVFSVEWTPSAYVFRIDGRETSRITRGISGISQYPILSLLSSDYELSKLGGEQNLPQWMSVDWVRFWQAPGYTPEKPAPR
jgi:beta-glucanase (GH16 family)